MQTLLHDLRYAVRQLRKTPGLTLLAVLSLMLGIGANTAIFTIIQSVLLRPLPYAHADRLLFIGPTGDKPGFGSTSWLNYRDIAAQAKLLEYAAGYSEDVSVVEGKDGSQSVVAPRVTTNLFSMLGAHPLLGRTFTEAEGQTSGPPVALLSEGLWRQTFGADPAHRRASGENRRHAAHGDWGDAGIVSVSGRAWGRTCKRACGCRYSPRERC